MALRSRPAPVLVTGMPRSGTTWLARLLASTPNGAMTGREPMNPHHGQYALARTLQGWAELAEPTRKQARALRLAYSGRTPFVFGKYGTRQWAAPLPWSQVVVKDPFALLSIPTIARLTRAGVVLVFRHPAAALVSYRRMGWQPNLEEVREVQLAHRRAHGGAQQAPPVPRPGEVAEAETIARFWSALHEIALDHAHETPGIVIVSHEELAAGGAPAARALFERVGLRWSARAEAEMASGGSGTPTDNAATGTAEATHQLHRLERAPGDVASEWRRRLDEEELQTIERVSATTYARLLAARTPLTCPEDD